MHVVRKFQTEIRVVDMNLIIITLGSLYTWGNKLDVKEQVRGHETKK